MADSARGLHGVTATDEECVMKLKWWGQVFGLCAFAAVTAMCARDDLEDETEDVVEAQQEAAEVAEENPGDTAAIREAGEEVIDEQREAAQQMQRELRDAGIPNDTLRPLTTQ
jgi:hypothetical protein